MEFPTTQVVTTATDLPTTAMDLSTQPTATIGPSTDLPTTAMDLSTEPTTAMDLSTDLPTTTMDLSTQSTTTDLSNGLATTTMDLSTQPTSTADLSTDLPTITMDLSADLTTMGLPTDSVETITTSTMLIMIMRVTRRPGGMDQSARGGIQKITIAVGVCGGITGILIVVILCICVACVLKCIKRQPHCDEQNNCDSGQQQSTSISSGTLVQMNTAYRQAIPNNNMDPIQPQVSTLASGQSMQFNSAYEPQNKMHEELETVNNGDYETMSGYVACCEDNLIQQDEKTITHLALPMVYETSFQQRQPCTCTGEDEEHVYEYIQ